MKSKSLANSFAGALAFLLALTGQSQASTFVSGNVSGTWNTAGSPYIATANVTVPSGQTLIIQPGVTLIMGQGLNMDVEGTITAIGSGASPIIIRGANPSLYWDRILINYMGNAQSSFANCIISDATNALYLIVNASLVGSATMNFSILNSTVTNCQSSCIFGYAYGAWGWNNHPRGNYNTTLVPKIQNCQFGASSNACTFLAQGSAQLSNTGRGAVNPQIVNCDFVSITGSAISFSTGDYAAATQPHVQNNIFTQCGTAIQNSNLAVFNDVTAYNCFYNNQTNFVGYPAGVYGTICCQNDRGTPCDLANNIFSNPLFAETNTYTLATNSPCIDAGTPDWALSDMCFPPSQGTAVTDIGIYGGPHAANWLSVVPKLPAQLSLTKSNNVLRLSWGAIPRSTYLVQCLATNLNATYGTNRWVTNTTVIPSDKPVSIVVSPYPTTNGSAYYRVKSLGRTDGN